MEDGLPNDTDDDENWMDTNWAEPQMFMSTAASYSGTFDRNQDCLKNIITDSGNGTSVSSCIRNDTGNMLIAETSVKSACLVNKGTEASVSRMLLNDNKAGMDGLDKAKINQIILEASRGSKFYESERKKEEQMKKRIEEQRLRLDSLTDIDLKQGEHEANTVLEALEQASYLGHTVVHIDMDAFYAAVEMRDRPELKNVPMAVGGNSMLSTSNYLARKYGVRAAMPGFIGKKLCPNLVIVPTNFEKYTEVSRQIREIMADYDPNFCPMSLDEAYLNITEYLVKRQDLKEIKRTVIVRRCEMHDEFHCLCDLNDVLKDRITSLSSVDSDCDNSSNSHKTNQNFEIDIEKSDHQDCPEKIDTIDSAANSDEKNNNILDRKKSICNENGKCNVCTRPLPEYEYVTFGLDAEEVVKELRCRIEQKTRLTASAGIAPNMMLAKVCSDRNKPNGQFVIPPTVQAVKNFIRDLPIRKISGIGKVSEQMLMALDIVTCSDLYKRRAVLYHLYSSISFNYFMRICLGIGSTTVERDGERKSISTERTFRELNKPSELYEKCLELCEALSKDLKNEDLMGKTVTLKLKTVKFEVKTKAQSLPTHTFHMDSIFTVARELLKNEIQACAPNSLRLRLMGVRMSNLLHTKDCQKRQHTLRGFVRKIDSNDRQEISPVDHGESAANFCNAFKKSQDLQDDDGTDVLNNCAGNTKILTEYQQSKIVDKSNVLKSFPKYTGNDKNNGVLPSDLVQKNSNLALEIATTTPATVTVMNKIASKETDEQGTIRNEVSENKLEQDVPETSQNKIFGTGGEQDVSETAQNKIFGTGGEQDVPETAQNKIFGTGGEQDVPGTTQTMALSEQEDKQEGLVNEKKDKQEGLVKEKKDFCCPVCTQLLHTRNLMKINKHIDNCLLKCSNSDPIDSEKKKFAVGSGNFESEKCLSEMPTSATHLQVYGECAGNKMTQDKECVVVTSPVCPICHIEQTGCTLEVFNNHVDNCLSKGAIREILKEQNIPDRPNLKRSGETKRQSSSKKKKLNRVEMEPKNTSIISYFKQ